MSAFAGACSNALALPTEERAKQMKARDYLWCALHLALDREELARLCPACRREAAEEVPGLRAPDRDGGGAERGLDEARFERLKRGERLTDYIAVLLAQQEEQEQGEAPELETGP